MHATKDQATRATAPAVGDVIVTGGHHVGGARIMGEILEVRGEPENERYRIRWEDGHESIFHPADGDATTTAPTQAEGTDEGTDTTASGR